VRQRDAEQEDSKADEDEDKDTRPTVEDVRKLQETMIYSRIDCSVTLEKSPRSAQTRISRSVRLLVVPSLFGEEDSKADEDEDKDTRPTVEDVRKLQETMIYSLA
jgi:hypothetical protein